MKALLPILCIGLIISGCSKTRTEPPEAENENRDVIFKISETEPLPPIGPNGSLPFDVVSFDVTATVINRSNSPRWFYGDSVDSPFYGLETRDGPNTAWVNDDAIGFCGTGTDYRELPAGHFTSFKLRIRASHYGKEARFKLTAFDLPNEKAGHKIFSNVIRVGK